MSAPAPALNGVLETALYVDDLPRATAFYTNVLGLAIMMGDERYYAFDAGRGSVLLLFRRGATLTPVRMEGGDIPPHDGRGPLHAAFRIDEAEREAWEDQLAAAGVEIEGRRTWPGGARSLYFRDPDGHMLELATPGLWPIY